MGINDFEGVGPEWLLPQRKSPCLRFGKKVRFEGGEREEAFSPLWLCCGKLTLKLNLCPFKLASIILFIFSVIDIIMTVIMLY